MAVTAQSIISRATQILQDTTSVRWPARELTRWLNDAQREIALYRPDSMSTRSVGTLAAGTRQNLVGMTGITNPAKLLSITRNMASSSTKKTVRMVSREVLDAQLPGWHDISQSINVVHYTFDEREPRVFYVYPPATNTAELEIIYSAYPTDITLPNEGVTIATSLSDTDTSVISGNFALPDIYANVALDYILYRAYSKDAEYTVNLQRAQAHYTAFANALGIEAKSLFVTGPSTYSAAGSPNVLRQGSAAAAV